MNKTEKRRHTWTIQGSDPSAEFGPSVLREVYVYEYGDWGLVRDKYYDKPTPSLMAYLQSVIDKMDGHPKVGAYWNDWSVALDERYGAIVTIYQEVEYEAADKKKSLEERT